MRAVSLSLSLSHPSPDRAAVYGRWPLAPSTSQIRSSLFRQRVISTPLRRRPMGAPLRWQAVDKLDRPSRPTSNGRASVEPAACSCSRLAIRTACGRGQGWRLIAGCRQSTAEIDLPHPIQHTQRADCRAVICRALLSVGDGGRSWGRRLEQGCRRVGQRAACVPCLDGAGPDCGPSGSHGSVRVCAGRNAHRALPGLAHRRMRDSLQRSATATSPKTDLPPLPADRLSPAERGVPGPHVRSCLRADAIAACMAALSWPRS